MNKNFKKLFFASALLVGLAGMSVSCKDYDNDINKLDSRVSQLETTVQSLDKQIKAGAVISDVKTTTEGITITLTNGKSYTLTNGKNGLNGKDGVNGKDGLNGKDGVNGKDGKDGKDGTSSVVTANSDGFWYINGEKTNFSWKGMNGKDASTVYYKPGMGENAGKWVKVVEEPGKEPVETVTDMAVYAPGTLTAVWNKENNTLTVYNAEGADANGIVLGGSAKLTSIVYAGNELYTGIDAFDNILIPNVVSNELAAKDTKDESYTSDFDISKEVKFADLCSVLSFYLNPSNVNPDNYDFKILTTRFDTKADGYDNIGIAKTMNYFDNVKQRFVFKVLTSPAKEIADSYTEAKTKKITNNNIVGKIDLFNLAACPKAMASNNKADYVHSHEFAIRQEMKGQACDFSIICPANKKAALVSSFNVEGKEPMCKVHGDENSFYVYRGLWAISNEHGARIKDVKIGVVDPVATIADKAVWANNSKYTELFNDCDAVIDYNKGSLDLSKVTELGSRNEMTKEAGLLDSLNLAVLKENYKLHYTYELVKKYNGTDGEGDEATEYAKYVKLDGSVITANGDTTAIGKTPVVRVTAVIENNGVEQKLAFGYVKVLIAVHADPNTKLNTTVNSADFAFTCKNAQNIITIPAETVKAALYDKVIKPGADKAGITTEDFLKLYQIAPAAEKKADNMKEDKDKGKEEKPVMKPNDVTANKITVKDDGSIVVTLTKEEAFKAAPKFTDSLHFSLKNPPRQGGVMKDVYITVNVKITGVNKSKDLMDSDLIENYWNKTKTESYFNVAVPDDNATDSTKCVFENNLNVPFTTWTEHDNNHTAGQIKLDPNVSKVAYSFDKEIYNHTADYDTLKPNFLVSDDGTTLSCKLGDGTMTEIATIDNKASVGGNIVTLKKNEVSEKLLNTKNFVVYYNIKGYVCGDEKNVFNVTVKGKDFFAVRYIRPINVKDISASHFTDGLDKGAEGTYIRFEDLLAPIDWRGYDFKTNTNYWDYYGTFKINIDKKNIKCNLGGDNVALPVNLKVDTEKSGTKNGVESKYGFLTYFNNGNKVTQDFELYVPVTIKYGWGEITETVTVPVMKTVENGK